MMLNEVLCILSYSRDTKERRRVLETLLSQLPHRQNVNEVCMMCGHLMEELSVCHLRCDNCGAEMDCSDKGSVW